jgi:maleamate amidohydrolase
MSSREMDQTYKIAGFGNAAQRGPRPAILVVDFSYGFTDITYPTAADMSEPVAATSRLLDVARSRSVPIAFTTISYDEAHIHTLPWLRKASGMAALRSGSRLVDIDERLARRAQEPLILKLGASAFFGTPLATILAAWQTDTLIVTGATTSGCVRASVVDAVQHGYDVLVPEECVADRARGPHQANLFDIQQKYGDVIPVAAAIRYVEDR